MKNRHTFVVPAYGCSQHLAACIDSLKAQVVPSEIIVSTSTPNADLAALCERHSVRLHVHSPNRGIGSDWNAALRASRTPLVTLAHQDDVYYPEFSRDTISAIEEAGDALLAFTDYEELIASGRRERNRLLWIKQILLHVAFVGRTAARDRFSKRNAIRFACPIPCPAVTIDLTNLPDGFDESFEVNLDWSTWLNATEVPGSFVWVRKVLMGHRIHEESETSSAISDGRRAHEDYRVLSRLWPSFVAKWIAGNYTIAYASNKD